MEFLTWLNENKPEHYKSMQVLHGEILMEGLNVLVNQFVNHMTATNGTGVLPEQKDFLLQPAELNTAKKYECKCSDCGKTYLSYYENDTICYNCLPF